jgi:exopolysaccharide biosynthesis protein
MRKGNYSMDKGMQHFKRQLLFSLCLCVSVVQMFSQDWKTVHDGVEYAQVEKEISGLKVKMNLLRLDLKKVRLDVHHAMDMAIGTEKTSSIATRHGGIAAINSGFFRLDKSKFAGDAAGALMIDGTVLSESLNNRAALGIVNNRSRTIVSFSHLRLESFLEIRKRAFAVGINRALRDDDVVLYSPSFGRSTLTDGSVAEFLLSKGRIIKIVEMGNNTFEKNASILSASGKPKEELLSMLKIGDRLELTLATVSENETSPKTLTKAEDITNGVPMLIRDGKIDVTWEQEKASKSFVETRHPRTAVAKLKDGKFLMITVDGRSESSGGMSLYELADYILSLGATDAMNLDGGGSTTMFLDGKVVNTPSDKEGERKVGDAIVVTLRNPKKR